MSLAREMSRGLFLKARLGVNGSQNALKSFGTSARWAGGFTAVAVVIGIGLLKRAILARTMAAAPRFVQFSLIYRRTLRKPAPLQLSLLEKEALPILNGACS